MAGLALSGGTLLSVLHGKRVYQPIWQIIAVQSSSGSSSNQLLVSDGKEISTFYKYLNHKLLHASWTSQDQAQEIANKTNF